MAHSLRASSAHCCLAAFLPITAKPDGIKNIISFHLFVDFLLVSGTRERQPSIQSPPHPPTHPHNATPPLFSESSLMPVPFWFRYLVCVEASEWITAYVALSHWKCLHTCTHTKKTMADDQKLRITGLWLLKSDYPEMKKQISQLKKKKSFS